MTASAHAFYERHGYKVVGETFIGKEDPTWEGPPAGIRVVSKAAQLCRFGCFCLICSHLVNRWYESRARWGPRCREIKMYFERHSREVLYGSLAFRTSMSRYHELASDLRYG